MRTKRKATRARCKDKPQESRSIGAIWKWVAGVAAAALAAVLAGVLTDWLQAVPGLDPLKGPVKDGDSPVTVAAQVWNDRCGFAWFVPKLPNQIDFRKPMRTPDEYGWGSYPAADGGAPGAPSTVVATVQGRTTTQVILTGIDIRVQQHRPAPSGTRFEDPCGGEGEFRWLNVDLDREPPRVTADVAREQWVDNEPPQPRRELGPGREKALEQDARPEKRPIRFPYKVSSTDAETFVIHARTVNCDCDWIALLSWQSAGHSGTIVINDHGRPFRTISTSRAVADCTSDPVRFGPGAFPGEPHCKRLSLEEAERLARQMNAPDPDEYPLIDKG